MKQYMRVFYRDTAELEIRLNAYGVHGWEFKAVLMPDTVNHGGVALLEREKPQEEQRQYTDRYG